MSALFDVEWTELADQKLTVQVRRVHPDAAGFAAPDHRIAWAALFVEAAGLAPQEVRREALLEIAQNFGPMALLGICGYPARSPDESSELRLELTLRQPLETLFAQLGTLGGVPPRIHEGSWRSPGFQTSHLELQDPAPASFDALLDQYEAAPPDQRAELLATACASGLGGEFYPEIEALPDPVPLLLDHPTDTGLLASLVARREDPRVRAAFTVLAGGPFTCSPAILALGLLESLAPHEREVVERVAYTLTQPSSFAARARSMNRDVDAHVRWARAQHGGPPCPPDDEPALAKARARYKL